MEQEHLMAALTSPPYFVSLLSVELSHYVNPDRSNLDAFCVLATFHLRCSGTKLFNILSKNQDINQCTF